MVACDVQTGLISATIVPSKEITKYSVTFLTKLVMDTGRTGGILASDNEPAINTLVNRVAQEAPGLTTLRYEHYACKLDRGNEA